MIVFDLDGCLIDSAALIRRSYRDVGVEVPDDHMTRPQGAWIDPDGEVRAAKDAAYLHRLATDELRPLPPWRAAEVLHAAGVPVALLTSAPDGTIRILARRAPTWPFMMTCAGLKPSAKTDWLARMGTGVYVDDQEFVTMPPGWELVHYVGQSAQELLRLIH